MRPRFDLRRVVLSASDGIGQLMHQLQGGRAVVSVRGATPPLCNKRAVVKSEDVFRLGLSPLGAFDTLLHLFSARCHEVLRASYKTFQNRKVQERYCGNGKDSLKQWRCAAGLARSRSDGPGTRTEERPSPAGTMHRL